MYLETRLLCETLFWAFPSKKRCLHLNNRVSKLVLFLGNISNLTFTGFWYRPMWPVVYHLFPIFWFADFFLFFFKHLLQLPLRKKKQQKRRDSMSSIIENYELNTPEKILKRRFDNAEDAEKIIEFITKDCFQIKRSTLIGWS